MSSLTPRIFGLAENGFDPATIAHMLGITFAQVDEGLRGLTVEGPSNEASGVGVFLGTSTGNTPAAAQAGIETFFADPAPGYAGAPQEPSFNVATAPFVVAPGGKVVEVFFKAAAAMLSPINIHFLVVNMAGTEALWTFSPESFVPADLGGVVFSPKSKDLHHPASKVGTDLYLLAEGNGEEEILGESVGEEVRSVAGGIFVVKAGVSLEPAR